MSGGGRAAARAAGVGGTRWAVRRHAFEPASLIWLAAVAVLAFLVLNPMVRLLIASFQATETGAQYRYT